MKKQSLHKLFLLVLIATLALSACGPKNDPKAAEVQLTNVAETVAVQFTKTAQARPSDTPIPTATEYIMPTMTPTAMPTMTVPTASIGTTPSTTAVTTATLAPTPAGGVDAGVWARSDPMDGTNIPAGSQFKVTVTLMNTGTTTWNTSYYIQMTGGDNLGLKLTKFQMPYEVPPQMSVQFTFDFTAPSTAGKVKNDWNIVNPGNVAFGVFWCEYNIVTP